MRLIDADGLLEELARIFEIYCDAKMFAYSCGVNCARQAVEDAITVDAVEVVRCEDCPDGCPVETPNDSRNRPENEPLTLSELYDIDSEPLYFHCTVGHWSLNGWHIVKAINYDGAQFKDVQLDNNDAHIESLYNYGITWLAYRRKPERSEG